MAFEETYKIIWKNEVVDEASTYDEAKFLQREYNLAFGGGATIKYEYDREAASKEETDYIENWSKNINLK